MLVKKAIYYEEEGKNKEGKKEGEIKNGLDNNCLTRCYVAPREGLEPPTRRLTAACSTN